MDLGGIFTQQVLRLLEVQKCRLLVTIVLRDAFERKAAKLAQYEAVGKTTILLVENDDIALMNAWKMLEAIQAAYPSGPPAGVRQIWYADTSIPNQIEVRDFTRELG